MREHWELRFAVQLIWGELLMSWLNQCRPRKALGSGLRELNPVIQIFYYVRTKRMRSLTTVWWRQRWTRPRLTASVTDYMWWRRAQSGSLCQEILKRNREIISVGIRREGVVGRHIACRIWRPSCHDTSPVNLVAEILKSLGLFVWGRALGRRGIFIYWRECTHNLSAPRSCFIFEYQFFRTE